MFFFPFSSATHKLTRFFVFIVTIDKRRRKKNETKRKDHYQFNRKLYWPRSPFSHSLLPVFFFYTILFFSDLALIWNERNDRRNERKKREKEKEGFVYDVHNIECSKLSMCVGIGKLCYKIVCVNANAKVITHRAHGIHHNATNIDCWQ